jgi:hypothetical protein
MLSARMSTPPPTVGDPGTPPPRPPPAPKKAAPTASRLHAEVEPARRKLEFGKNLHQRDGFDDDDDEGGGAPLASPIKRLANDLQ